MSELDDPNGSGGPGVNPGRAPSSTSRVGRLLGRTRQQRFAAILVGIAAVLSLGLGAGLLAAHRAGSIIVQVDGRGCGGDDVRLCVPAAAAHLALLFMPDRSMACSGGRHGLRPGDMKTLLRALETIPDGTVLVQVDSPREAVRISRESGRILIGVDSEDERVRVEVPVSLANAFLRKVERMAQDG